MKVRDTNHDLLPTFMICVTEFRDLCPCELCCKHLDMSRWFVSATFMICVRDFPHGKVLAKVGVMETRQYQIKLGHRAA